MVNNRRRALRLAAVAALATASLGIGAGTAIAQTDGLPDLLAGVGTSDGTPEGAQADGDQGNSLDEVTDLVQDILPGGVGGDPLVNVAPLNVEVPGLADVAADVDVLESDSLAEVPCLGIGLGEESASCPEPTPTDDERDGNLMDIPVDLSDVPVVGDVTGDVNVDDDLDTDVCLNAELLGDLTEGPLDAVSSGVGSQDCLGSGGENPPATGVGSTVPGTTDGDDDNGNGGGDTLPFTGAEGVLGLSGLGLAMFAGGHLLRRFTAKP